jgi:hypothetical protein
MNLSSEEEFLFRRWIHVEAHFRDGPGPPKGLLLAHGIIPADLATIMAAAIHNAN